MRRCKSALPWIASGLLLVTGASACGGPTTGNNLGGISGSGENGDGDEGGEHGGAPGAGAGGAGAGTGGPSATTGPLMRPGENCLSCHAFTLAGTVYDGSGVAAGGVTVTVTPGAGAPVVLTSNAAGNFFTAAPIAFPTTVLLTKGSLSGSMNAPAGSCNGCHGPGFRITVR